MGGWWGKLTCTVEETTDRDGDGRVPAKHWYDVTDEYGTPYCKFTKDEFDFVKKLQNDNKLFIDLKEFFGHVNWEGRKLTDQDVITLENKNPKVIDRNHRQCPEPENYATFDAMLRYMSARSGNVFRLLQCKNDHNCLKALKETFTYKYLIELNFPKLNEAILNSSISLDTVEEYEYRKPLLVRNFNVDLMMLVASTLIRLECIKLKELAKAGGRKILSATDRPVQTTEMPETTAVRKVLGLLNNEALWITEIKYNYGLVSNYSDEADVKIKTGSHTEDIATTLEFVRNAILNTPVRTK